MNDEFVKRYAEQQKSLLNNVAKQASDAFDSVTGRKVQPDNGQKFFPTKSGYPDDGNGRYS